MYRRLFALNIFYPALLPGVLLLVLLTRANVVLSPVENFSETPAVTQFWILSGAVALVTLGLGLTRAWTPQFSLGKDRRRELLIVALIAAFAFVLRVILLEDALHLFVHDEFWFTEGISRFHRDPYTPLLPPFMDPTPYTGVFAMMQLMLVNLFGASLTALRLPSVLFGTGTVIATYALGRQLFSSRVALLGALLLAVFPPHIHISRLGINNIADPFFGVLALACLARGVLHDSASRWTWALGGSALGLTFYFYDAGKFVFTPLMVGWLICLLLGKRLSRQHVIGLLVFGAAALMVSFPVLYTTAVGGFAFSARLGQMTWGLRFLTEDVYNLPPTDPLDILLTYFQRYIVPVLAFYVSTPDSEPYFYGGQTAMLLPPLVPLFLLGVLYCLWKWRDARSQLLLLWLTLTTMGISLIYPATWMVRYPVVFTAMLLLVALCSDRLMAWLPRGQRLWQALFALLLVIQPLYYFALHLPYYNQQIRPQTDYTDAMFRAAQFPRREHIHFITTTPVDVPRTWTLKDFWALDAEVFYQPSTSDLELRALPRDVDLIFFVEQGDTRTQHIIQQVFPAAQPLLSPYNLPLERQYVLFYVAASP